MAFSIDCLGKKSKNFDKKIYKFAFLFTITLILIIFLSSETSAKTISVAKDGSGNYEKIQTAINNSQNGDNINVKNGIYQENILINKIISLNGQDKEKTVIDANNHEDGIKIEANWVNISNFRITNCGENDFDSGIEIRSSNVQVTNCSISDNKGYGIYLKKSDNNKIANCSKNNNSDGGIYMDECLGNIIRDCKFLNNPSNGIHLSDSSLNKISNNLINNNTGKGISFYFYSSNNIIKNNIISNNSVNGIKIYYESSSNNIYNNDFIFNEKHAFDECENNWNSSDSGNFWSGFFKEDKNEDGYIDMPYGIQGAGNQDNFPYFNSINSKFPPIISHTKIENVNEGNSVSIICSFKSVKNINEAFVFYRKLGTETYKKISLNEDLTNFKATIPNIDIKAPGLEYYIQAEDELNIGTLPINNPELFPFEIIIYIDKPDLQIKKENISYSKNNPEVGEIIVIYANISNIGYYDATEIEVNLFDDIEFIQKKTILRIGSNSESQISFDYLVKKGVNNIQISVDHDDKIDEIIESNNEASKELKIGGDNENSTNNSNNPQKKDKSNVFIYFGIIGILGIGIIVFLIVLKNKSSETLKSQAPMQNSMHQQYPGYQPGQSQSLSSEPQFYPFQQPNIENLPLPPPPPPSINTETAIQAMKRCDNCGAQIPAETSFCFICGNQFIT